MLISPIWNKLISSTDQNKIIWQKKNYITPNHLPKKHVYIVCAGNLSLQMAQKKIFVGRSVTLLQKKKSSSHFSCLVKSTHTYTEIYTELNAGCSTGARPKAIMKKSARGTLKKWCQNSCVILSRKIKK